MLAFMSVRYHPTVTSRPVLEPRTRIADGPRSGGPRFGVLRCVGRSRRPAQDGQRDNGGRKQARAVRVADGAIRVDGRLDDEAWRAAPPSPTSSRRSRSKARRRPTAWRCASSTTTTALYVGARMYSSAPIQAPLGRRDEGEQAEHLLVSLDTYLDRRTASTFGVTASGVRLDHYHASDDEFERRRHVQPGLAGAHRRSTSRAGRRSCGFRSRSCASTIAVRRSGA